jgi:hypothetical protein
VGWGVALGPGRPPLFGAPFPVPRPAVSDRALRTATLAAALAFVAATTLGVGGLIERRAAIAFGASSTLSVLGGDVATSSDGLTFEPASDGDVVRAGTTLRTSSSGYAVITYFDGSTVSLDPDTTLTLSTLGSDPDGTKTILMRQDFGRTWHVVQRLLTGASRYQVTTPTMTASVRGTSFAIAVGRDAAGDPISTLDTVEGAVAAAKTTGGQPAQEVVVRAGFRATFRTGAPIDGPVPSPEPDRTITITLGARSGVVVDGVGRSNGILEGRVMAQTPGARVERRGGELVVKLPNVPDGKVLAMARGERSRAAVGLFTDVQEKSTAVRSSRQRVPADESGLAVAAVEIRGGQPPTIAAAADDEVALVTRATRGGAPKERDQERKKDDSGGGPGPGGAGGGFVLSADLPGLPFSDRAPADDRRGEASGGTRSAPAAAPQGSVDATGGDRARGGFVPSAPLPDIPALSGPAPKDPSKPNAPQPGDTTKGTTTDPRSPTDRGGSKPDAKGRP